MVEADSHLKLLPTSILDKYKVIEHIDMLSMGIQYQPCTDTHTTWLRFWGSGSLVESKRCHDVMVEADSNLKLDDYASLTAAETPSGQGEQSPSQGHQRCLHINGNNAIKSKNHHRNNGEEACASSATMPSR